MRNYWRIEASQAAAWIQIWLLTDLSHDVRMDLMSCPRCQAPHRFHPVKMQVNGREINQVEICPYFEKHDDINDTTVLALVFQLDHHTFPEDGRNDCWAYFATEMTHEEKLYRLVWLLEDNTVIIGVVNCFRRD